jgi:LmbE family N-acetylglucosaminyl deacetylase
MNPHYLVLAAHPDDEIIGCGITLQRDPQALVIVVTDGRKGTDETRPDLPPDQMARERRRESRAVLADLGVRDVHFLDQTEGEFHPSAALEMVRRITGDGQGLDAIYCHRLYDEHPDHRRVAVVGLMLAMDWNVRLWQFAVSYSRLPYRDPDWIIAASPAEVARKNSDLLRYRAQQHVTQRYLNKPEVFWKEW